LASRLRDSRSPPDVNDERSTMETEGTWCNIVRSIGLVRRNEMWLALFIGREVYWKAWSPQAAVDCRSCALNSRRCIFYLNPEFIINVQLHTEVEVSW
jgi:hypothetical protein